MASQVPNIEPVFLDIEYPDGLSRKLILFKWLFAVPLYVILIFHGFAAFVVAVVASVVVLVTGRVPRGMFDFLVGFNDRALKTFAYFPLLLTDAWDPTEGASQGMGAVTSGLSDHPLVLRVQYPERLSRIVLLFLKLPSYPFGVVTVFLILTLYAMLLVSVLATVPVLVTGNYPRAMFRINSTLLRWFARLSIWQWPMCDDLSLFSDRRNAQVLLGTAAVAIVLLGLLPWISISTPASSFIPGPLTIVGVTRLNQDMEFEEIETLIEEFMTSLAAGEIEHAANLTKLPGHDGLDFMSVIQVEQFACTQEGLFDGLVEVHLETLEDRPTTGLRRGEILQTVSGTLTYPRGSLDFAADLVKAGSELDIRSLTFGTRPWTGDTDAPQAGFARLQWPFRHGSPGGLAVDPEGNLYFTLTENHRVWRLDESSGEVTVIAGLNDYGYSGDGDLAVDARLAAPRGLAADDEGNIYIADKGNDRVRRIDGRTGVITTIAQLDEEPADVDIDDSGNLYIIGFLGGHIRKLDLTTGTISTFNPGESWLPNFSVDSDGIVYVTNQLDVSQIERSGRVTPINGTAVGARAVGVDPQGNLFIGSHLGRGAEGALYRRDATSGEVTLVAGTVGDYSGDGGPASEAGISTPWSIVVDRTSNVYLADTANRRIRRIDGSSGLIDTVWPAC